MPVARLLLIAVLGAALIGGAFLATRGGGEAPAASAGSSSTATDGATVKSASPKSASRGKQGLPRDVARAIANDRVVMILLYQPRAADDSATLGAMRELEAARTGSTWLRDRTALFTDPITKAADYLGVTQALGMTRAPAVLLLQPDGQARLLEGYTDDRSLRQHLTDALR